jgi:UDP-N-acetylglucosamine 3-dehydrogenase
MKELRIAVIGLGFGRRHIQAYQHLPGVTVAAIVARSAERREQAAQEYGIPAAYADHRQLLSEEEIDLVSICTPDRLHARQALDALQAGVHVLCEKPIATTIEEAAALVRAVRRTGLIYAAGHNYRFFSQFARLKALADDGAVGDLLLGESSYVQDLYDMEGLGPNYWRLADPQDFYLGGAIHNVDLLRWVMGEVCEVHAYSAHGMPFYPLDDTYVSNYTFENGRIGRLLLVLGARLKDKFRFDLKVYGREGALRAALGRSEVEQDVGAHGRAPVPQAGAPEVEGVDVGEHGCAPLPQPDALALEIAHVVECVRRDQSPLVDVVEGAKAVAVCLAAVRSAREGRPVAIDYSFK